MKTHRLLAVYKKDCPFTAEFFDHPETANIRGRESMAQHLGYETMFWMFDYDESAEGAWKIAYDKAVREVSAELNA